MPKNGLGLGAVMGLAARRRGGYTGGVRLPPSVSVLLFAVCAAAAPPTPAAPETRRYHTLESGSRVPIPKGYRAASRTRPEDPESEVVVLFPRGEAAEALKDAEPKEGRIVVEVTALTEREREDPGFPKRLENGLRKKAKARVGKVAYAWMKDAPHKALSYRQRDPGLAVVYLFAPKRLVKISAQGWSEAVAEIVKGYQDGP